MNHSRFTVAIHVLTLLAHCGPEPQTSEFIAGSVNTNPVVIRRLLSHLRAARLVASQGGPGGGWHLLKAPESITLKAIFKAMEEHPILPLHSSEPNPHCAVGRTIQSALHSHFHAAQAALEAELERVTIAHLLVSVRKKA